MNKSIVKREVREKRLKLLKESRALQNINLYNDLNLKKAVEILNLQDEKYKKYKFYDEIIKRL